MKKSHGIKCRSATQEHDPTEASYCTKHGQNPTHSTDMCFTLKNRTEKAKKNFKSGLTKKRSFRKSESSYEKISLDHMTIKTTDEYETQTDTSDSPSENKRTKFTNTRHINTELKILMHSQQQLKLKDFLWCFENKQPL
jgi:trehalose/maltose hydrolase-like predicted phosphorylase